MTVFYFDFMEESAQRTVLMNGASWRVFLRSFFIEIMWNYPRMQNIGFTFCSLPAVDRLTGAKDVRLDITRRLLESANTNPVFGPMCLGAMARIESFPERLPTAGLIKKRLMSTLAAQGDRIFWGVIRPLASFFAVIVSLTSAPAWLVPIVALSIYNIPNVVTRFIGFDMGWRKGSMLLEDSSHGGSRAMLESFADWYFSAPGHWLGPQPSIASNIRASMPVDMFWESWPL